MYSPAYAIETDQRKIQGFLEQHSFATLIYQEAGKCMSFPLPLVLENGKLIGHMALANDAVKVIDGQELLILFHGPHAYISPTYYGREGNVPTWNYLLVQVRGKVSVKRDRAFLEKAMTLLSQHYDPDFDIQKNMQDHDKLFQAVVGLEIEILESFAKFKLAQNKSAEERKSVIAHLEQRAHHELARAMKDTL